MIKPEVSRLMTLRSELAERLMPEVKFEIHRTPMMEVGFSYISVVGNLGGIHEYAFACEVRGNDQPESVYLERAESAVRRAIRRQLFIDHDCSWSDIEEAEQC
jgi:hypothetical protein